MIRIEDLIELFIEMQDSENQRPDFSLVKSKEELRKIFSSISKKNEDTEDTEMDIRPNTPYKLYSESQGNISIL